MFVNICAQSCRTHTGVKPYARELCSRRFSDQSNLAKHRKNKHGLTKPIQPDGRRRKRKKVAPPTAPSSSPPTPGLPPLMQPQSAGAKPQQPVTDRSATSTSMSIAKLEHNPSVQSLHSTPVDSFTLPPLSALLPNDAPARGESRASPSFSRSSSNGISRVAAEEDAAVGRASASADRHSQAHSDDEKPSHGSTSTSRGPSPTQTSVPATSVSIIASGGKSGRAGYNSDHSTVSAGSGGSHGIRSSDNGYKGDRFHDDKRLQDLHPLPAKGRQRAMSRTSTESFPSRPHSGVAAVQNDSCHCQHPHSCLSRRGSTASPDPACEQDQECPRHPRHSSNGEHAKFHHDEVSEFPRGDAPPSRHISASGSVSPSPTRSSHRSAYARRDRRRSREHGFGRPRGRDHDGHYYRRSRSPYHRERYSSSRDAQRFFPYSEVPRVPEIRSPRVLVPETDPRFVSERTREALRQLEAVVAPFSPRLRQHFAEQMAASAARESAVSSSRQRVRNHDYTQSLSRYPASVTNVVHSPTASPHMVPASSEANHSAKLPMSHPPLAPVNVSHDSPSISGTFKSPLGADMPVVDADMHVASAKSSFSSTLGVNALTSSSLMSRDNSATSLKSMTLSPTASQGLEITPQQSPTSSSLSHSETAGPLTSKGSCDSGADVDDLVNSFLVEARAQHGGDSSATTRPASSSIAADSLLPPGVDASAVSTRVGSPMEDLFLAEGTTSSMLDCSR